MSLVIAAFVPTGIVLSADSRTTGTSRGAPQPVPGNASLQTVLETNLVLSDSASKLFLLFKSYGVATVGDALVNNLPIAKHVAQYEASVVGAPPQTVQACAQGLLAFFRTLAPIPNVVLLVAGYDGVVPWVNSVEVQNNVTSRLNVNAAGQVLFGLLKMGETAVVDRILSQPQFNPLFDVMQLQDAADYSRYLVRSTIDEMRFEPRFATVGGPIDTLVLQSTGGQWLALKELRAT
jgi:hypothetical protein